MTFEIFFSILRQNINTSLIYIPVIAAIILILSYMLNVSSCRKIIREMHWKWNSAIIQSHSEKLIRVFSWYVKGLLGIYGSITISAMLSQMFFQKKDDYDIGFLFAIPDYISGIPLIVGVSIMAGGFFYLISFDNESFRSFGSLCWVLAVIIFLLGFFFNHTSFMV